MNLFRRHNDPKPESNPCAVAHDLRLISRQSDSGAHFGFHRVTLILMRCTRCGEHRTNCIAGDWDLPTLLHTDHEILELERMYER